MSENGFVDVLVTLFYWTVGFLAIIGVSCIYVGITSNEGIYTSDGFKQRAIEIKAAQYNSTTGDFEYTDEDLEYIMLGENDEKK